MGNSLRKYKLSRMTNDTPLGKETRCPIGNESFSATVTYGVFNSHIDICQNRITFVPTIPSFTKKISTGKKIGEGMNQDLRTKNSQLRLQIGFNTISFVEGSNLLKVRRSNILEDSIEQFTLFNNRKELKVQFEGENSSGASDAGGMTKEWFTVVSKELLKPENGIFRQGDADKISYFVDEQSEEQKDNSEKFFFVGLFMAKAIFDKIPINLGLSKAIFKFLLDEDGIELDELIDFDAPLYHSLKYINDNNIDDGSGGDMYFVHLRKDGKEEELTGDGKDIKVTESNKYQFIGVKIDFITKEIVESQLNEIKRGFYTLLDQKWLINYTADDLEKTLGGKSEIDVQEWEISAQYKGDYHADHEVIRWFWDIVSNYSQTELVSLLQFGTGTPRLPIGGFHALEGNRGFKHPFTIESMTYSAKTPFPRAHTCFNRLQLPKYKSYKDLKKNLDFVVQQCEIYGFGLED